jgi:predicted transglutaminase-like cysteine proteinase
MPLLLALLLVLATSLSAAAGTGTSGPVFGSSEARTAPPRFFSKWERALARVEAERAGYEECEQAAERCPNPGTKAWRDLLLGLVGAPRLEQIRKVNGFVNSVRYVSDLEHHGVTDYWATPIEFFAGAGDCEDSAIAKYVSLRDLGVPAESLRLVVLEDTVRRLAHAVLTVAHGGQHLVLDNVTDTITPDYDLAHYVPYYSVNESAGWVHHAQRQTMPAVAASDGHAGVR